MKDVVFVGWVNQGRKPVDGETTKNQYIIAELQKYCKVHVLDFYQKNKHPWIYLQALWAFFTKPKATIILSTSVQNVYSILKLFKKVGVNREIIHWVIGGSFGQQMINGRFDVGVFNFVKYNLVQCKGMITQLEEAGVKNAKFVSNFKPINYYPDLDACQSIRDKDGKTRFVFLSRIRPEKGCDYIFQAAKRLNDNGFTDKYIIDFYGKVDVDYQEEFNKNIDSLENVNFHGLLDMTKKEGYDVLATYHAMLFPTYWRGEGFAGVFIDAFIAGLPVFASDWAHNAESILDGELGVIYPVHDADALMTVMERAILGEYDLNQMARKARAEAPKYQTDNALSKEYLQSIELVD